MRHHPIDVLRPPGGVAKLHGGSGSDDLTNVGQLLGARGYSKDTPLEWMYRYARQARLVDGASEVHRMIVARDLLRPEGEFFAWS